MYVDLLQVHGVLRRTRPANTAQASVRAHVESLAQVNVGHAGRAGLAWRITQVQGRRAAAAHMRARSRATRVRQRLKAPLSRGLAPPPRRLEWSPFLQSVSDTLLVYQYEG